MDSWIQVRDAQTHNLRAVDVTLPLGKLVVFTGVSGSGKTSLAFDTIHAEGRRRFLECAAPFSQQQQFRLPRPAVADVIGLPPTLSVSQVDRQSLRQPRATVATITEIHDYFRLLFARCGTPHCPQCQRRLAVQDLNEIINTMAALPEQTKVYVLAPLAYQRPGPVEDLLRKIVAEGFLRARVDGVLGMADQTWQVDEQQVHTVEVVVDRQVVRPDMTDRWRESISNAVRLGNGTVLLALPGETEAWEDQVFNTRLRCFHCDRIYPDLEPRHFSFNSPIGACATCQGLGAVTADWSLLLPDPEMSLLAGAIPAFRTKTGKITAGFRRELEHWVRQFAQQVATRPTLLNLPATPPPSDQEILDRVQSFLQMPIVDLPGPIRESLWEGVPGFVGLRERLQQRQEAASEKEEAEDSDSADTGQVVCPDCHGDRLGPLGRSIQLSGKSLPEWMRLTIASALTALEQVLPSLHGPTQTVAAPLVQEIANRLRFLDRVGVGYVELERPLMTLSGGEAQRIRLASCVGAGLNGICYILDEPTIGLHPRDTLQLLQVLQELRDRGNTVFVVEHEEIILRHADFLVDLGPAAGRLGGQIVNQGPLPAFLQHSSLTADYLNQKRTVVDLLPEKNRCNTDWNTSTPAALALAALPTLLPTLDNKKKTSTAPKLTLTGIKRRNLLNLDISIPLEQFVCVTGVSGSGKSTLIAEVLVPILRQKLRLGRQSPAMIRALPERYDEITGVEYLERMVQVDQTPIGRSPRSTPCSFTGALDEIRTLFAATKEARKRGYNTERFSYNHSSGQCSTCRGLGSRSLDVDLAPDEIVLCPDCDGQRYNPQTLTVRYRDRSIAEVLAMDLTTAAEFFAAQPRLAALCQTLVAVGLGYLRLDQPAPSLSGGEAQRLKLASELSRLAPVRTLFILDEPTTGLHFHDVAHLLALLRLLVQRGHSVLIVEHDLDLIAHADWIIDLGPEGGSAGGRIVAEGTPIQIAQCPESYTGQALRSTGKVMV